jgi:uncharacterized Fe-S cluster protein YjdI
MEKKLYSNGQIEVSWEPKLCKHTGICFRGMPGVFDPRRKPWIILENGENEAILAQVARCPSGALKARTLDAPPGEE